MEINATYLRSIELINNGRYEEAKINLKVIISLFPSGSVFSEVNLRIAQLEDITKGLQRACILAERGIKNDPSHIRSRIALSEYLRKIGNPQRAFEVMRGFVVKDNIAECAPYIVRSMISIPEYDYQSGIFSILSENDIKKSRFLELIASIIKLERENVKAIYKKWSAENIYDVPLVDMFYLKHALLSFGERADRNNYESRKPSISISSISYYGRFTHALKNYVAAKLYSEENGFELQTPEWTGHYFFDLSDPFIKEDSGRNYVFDENIISNLVYNQKNINRSLEISRNHDLFSPESFVFLSRYKEKVQSILKVRPFWEKIKGLSVNYLRKKGETLVSIHIRLGDMEWKVNEKYGSINYQAYIEWIEAIWPSLRNPVLFIASDNPIAAKDIFRRYEPLVVDDIPVSLPVVQSLQDFYIMMNSDIVAISRGGFGWTAAALNKNSASFFCQSYDGKEIIPFSPWPDKGFKSDVFGF